MRKLLLAVAILVPAFAGAQTVATFEALPLASADTFYINTTPPQQDRGFDDGLAHFQYSYDTSFGGYWASGFAYSNKTDSVTSGAANQYSAKAGKGYGGSAKYLVHWQSYDGRNDKVILKGAAKGKAVSGFYVTNSTYAYNSMRSGDAVAKKFGGATGNDPDFFLLTVYGYSNGSKKADSVNFYLADFRSANNASDYIVKDWRWVSLQGLGAVDSLSFGLSSSDNGSFGMNTPAYFCMDNFTTNETGVGVPSVGQAMAKVYPNPAAGQLFVETSDRNVTLAAIYDITGKQIAAQAVTGDRLRFNTSNFAPGVYLLKLEGNAGSATVRFVKQ